MREPVRILSDLHLGHPASKIGSAEELRPLLEGAATVVFNGDTWQELAKSFRVKSERLLDDLEALCAELGVEAVFLSGNHDPGWPGKGWIELAAGRVVVTHGDAVLWAGSPWSREAIERVAKIRSLWEEHRHADDDASERLLLARKVALALRARRHPRGRSFLRRVVDAVNPPRRALEILSSWLCQASSTAEFGRHYFPKAEFIICGHFHWPGVWHKHGRVVINTGAFVNPHAAGWVEWSDGWLRCGKVRENDGWSIGPTTGVWRFTPVPE